VCPNPADEEFVRILGGFGLFPSAGPPPESRLFEGAAKEIEDSWNLSFNAASYHLSENIDLEKGLKYAALSTTVNEVYWNLRIKAQLEANLGKKRDAIKSMSRAIELGSEMDSAPFDFERMKGLLAKWQSE